VAEGPACQTGQIGTKTSAPARPSFPDRSPTRAASTASPFPAPRTAALSHGRQRPPLSAGYDGQLAGHLLSTELQDSEPAPSRRALRHQARNSRIGRTQLVM